MKADYPGGVILAVDTSLGTAVAVVDPDGSSWSEAAAVDPLGHAEVIGDLLVQVLDDTDDAAITHVVAGMGPGPFTGLRIGIATARAFALGRCLAVVPVPSHYAAALTAIESDGVDGPFAVVTDARRREVAITVFDGTDDDGIPNVIAATTLVPQAESDARLGSIRRLDVASLTAVDLAKVGARAVAAGRELGDSEPLYLRQPDVRVPGVPKRVGS